MRAVFFFSILFCGFQAFSAEWLLKAQPGQTPTQLESALRAGGTPVVRVQDLRFNSWFLVVTTSGAPTFAEANFIGGKSRATWVEANRRFHAWDMMPPSPVPTWHPSPSPTYRRYPDVPPGPDPQEFKQWALEDTGFVKVQQYFGNPKLVVAVIDTGVDYMHPDLNHMMWMNPGEAGAKANNGIDDDRNGYVDDFMGWNFSENNNQPFDRTGAKITNRGHGTHCAGSIGAERGNAFELAGIASGVQIMAVRFMGDDGTGSDANALLAIKYAVDNGAAILSNSWGGADDDPNGSRALKEMFLYASQHNRLMIVAAGNGSTDLGANPKADEPATYNVPTQINVAATDGNANMAGFSNYGRNIVHLGAPGVNILSTIPGGGMLAMDGTSMSTPIVAGAAALFWSQRPDLNALQVKQLLLATVTPTPALQGKVMTGGRLNIEALMSKVGHPPFRFR